ncbi:MAG: FAD-dependent oxidoreductase [Alphaproteobacteria bacterium]
MRIGIIGSGISGLGAAWLLHKDHDIQLFEAANRIGGHSHTIDIDYDGERMPVDTGFIVYNEINYPNLTALFKILGVTSEASDMSFAVSTGGGKVEWGSDSLGTVFAQRRNLFRPRFLSTLMEIQRFNKNAPGDMRRGALTGLTLNAYLNQNGYSKDFRSNYLFPMGGAIWSMPETGMQDFPAESFVSFCNNHFLLSRDRPRWRTVSGGSREYVKILTARFADRIHINSPIVRVCNQGGKVLVQTAGGQQSFFDHVIIAAHGDQALCMLETPGKAERDILGKIRYAPNIAYVHSDPALMPRMRKVWSSWNYISQDSPDFQLSVSYWMNRLQNINPAKPLFITLNPVAPPVPELTYAAIEYAHVQFDMDCLRAQRQLSSIQGIRNIWYCGAWTAHGFHEDGLCSGLAVAEKITGQRRPWAEPAACDFQEAAE